MTEPNKPSEVSSQKAKAFSQPSERAHLCPTENVGDRIGAPRKRGLGGSFQSIRELHSRAEVRVWFPLVGRAVSVLGVLSTVAFLGAKSEVDDTYGRAVALPLPFQEQAPVDEGHSHEHAPGETAHVSTTETSEKEVPAPCEKPEETRLSGVTADGKIILNEASQEELMRLKGIGASRAQAILALRARLGGFKKLTDLLRVKGIGFKTLQAMKDQLLLERPKPESEAPPGEAPQATSPGSNVPVSSKGPETKAPGVPGATPAAPAAGASKSAS